jgi:hypothetical protein
MLGKLFIVKTKRYGIDSLLVEEYRNTLDAPKSTGL